MSETPVRRPFAALKRELADYGRERGSGRAGFARGQSLSAKLAFLPTDRLAGFALSVNPTSLLAGCGSAYGRRGLHILSLPHPSRFAAVSIPQIALHLLDHLLCARRSDLGLKASKRGPDHIAMMQVRSEMPGAQVQPQAMHQLHVVRPEPRRMRAQVVEERLAIGPHDL